MKLSDQKTYVMTKKTTTWQTEILCKWNGKVRSDLLEQKKNWTTAEGRPFALENFSFDLRVPFASQLVEPKI